MFIDNGNRPDVSNLSIVKRAQILTDHLTTTFPMGPLSQSGHTYYFSSDAGRAETLEHAQSMLASQEVQDGKLRIGMIIGTGAWQSILPEIMPHVDMILFCDRNPYLHTWIAYAGTTLEQQLSFSTYKRALYNDYWSIENKQYSPFKSDFLTDDYGYDLREIEEKSLGDKHLLSSDERYNECRSAYLQAKEMGKKFVPVFFDFTKNEDFVALSKIIGTDTLVRYVDFTNLAEALRKDAGYAQNIKEFFAQWPEIVVVHSEDENGEKLQSEVNRGIDSYITKAFAPDPIVVFQS